MKKIIVIVLLFFCTAAVQGQSNPDSVYEQYHSAKTVAAL